VSIAAAKENLRIALAGTTLSREDGNRAAEQLRRLPAYRGAKLLFASPAPALLQLRINALADGKELLMPGPGLREGFYLLKPYVIPLSDLQWAVTLKGLLQFGKRVDRKTLGALSIDLMLTGAVAVDNAGGRLGSGQGFFDLTCAVLHEFKIVAAKNRIIGVVAEAQVVTDELPREPWDILLDWLVTPEGCREFEARQRPLPAVFWEELPPRRIRKMTPLWQLFQERRVRSESGCLGGGEGNGRTAEQQNIEPQEEKAKP
jgi:5-formyltetrahydrofolate cyclo-ligase